MKIWSPDLSATQIPPMCCRVYGEVCIHYDLHAWIWEDNPKGVFAQYNPEVSCKTPAS